jgi:dihydrolipoamide dehydrogenase
MASLGIKVVIAEIASRLLPDYETEAGELIANLLHKQKNVQILTQTRTVAVEKENIARRVTYSRAGHEHTLRVDQILVCAGRRPNVDLGLENAGVAYSDKGIVVNNYLQTSAKHIYATGDVLGDIAGHTHTALLQSRVAAHNILSKKPNLSPDYSATPHVIFTYPAIATVGLTEDDCLRRDLHIKKAVVPLAVIARSNTSDFKNGFVKLITDKKGVLIGATVMAPEAGESIHELALAIKYGLTAEQVATTPHAFLTWAEAIRIAASKIS